MVWEALLDPQVLARTLPGCDDLRADGEHRFRGVLNMKIGPIQGRFDGSVDLTDLVAPNRYTLAMKGQGPAGFVDGKGLVQLEDDGDGTAVVYDIDARVGGRLASVGQRLLDSTARAVTNQALEGLGRQLAFRQAAVDAAAGVPAGSVVATATDAGDGPAVAAPPLPPLSPPPDAPGKVEFAAGVARDVAADLARDTTWRLIAGGVTLFVVLVLWWVFG